MTVETPNTVKPTLRSQREASRPPSEHIEAAIEGLVRLLARQVAAEVIGHRSLITISGGPNG